MIKHYLKRSDTCNCQYVQTHDKDLEVGGVYNSLAWGAVESYVSPSGQSYTTVRCAIHAGILIQDLNDVLLNRECRVRNLVVKELLTNTNLSAVQAEILMARCVWGGPASDRTLTFAIPELNAAQKSSEQTRIRALYGNKVSLV